MPKIAIHNDDSILNGAVLFLNKAVAAYLEDTQEKIDKKFKDLRKASLLYITDLRFPDPSKGEKYGQVDLVGFDEKNNEVCFTLRTDAHLNIKAHKIASLDEMSALTKDMVSDIKDKLSLNNTQPMMIKGR